jgi:hypothetical protein
MSHRGGAVRDGKSHFVTESYKHSCEGGAHIAGADDANLQSSALLKFEGREMAVARGFAVAG